MRAWAWHPHQDTGGKRSFACALFCAVALQELWILQLSPFRACLPAFRHQRLPLPQGRLLQPQDSQLCPQAWGLGRQSSHQKVQAFLLPGSCRRDLLPWILECRVRLALPFLASVHCSRFCQALTRQREAENIASFLQQTLTLTQTHLVSLSLSSLSAAVLHRRGRGSTAGPPALPRWSEDASTGARRAQPRPGAGLQSTATAVPWEA